MDDFILFSNDKKELGTHLNKIRDYALTKLQLNLKEKVIRISPVSEGLPFLGYRIFRGITRLQRANLIRFRRKIAKLERCYLEGEIEREDLANSVRSMVVHISHGNTIELRRKLFFGK